MSLILVSQSTYRLNVIERDGFGIIHIQKRNCMFHSHRTDSKRNNSVDASQTEDMGGGDGGGSQP